MDRKSEIQEEAHEAHAPRPSSVVIWIGNLHCCSSGSVHSSGPRTLDWLRCKFNQSSEGGDPEQWSEVLCLKGF